MENNKIYGISYFIDDDEYKKSEYFRQFADAISVVNQLNKNKKNLSERYFTFSTTENEIKKNTLLLSKITCKDDRTKSLISKLLGIHNVKIYNTAQDYYDDQLAKDDTILDQ